ncbi:hypothetical protein LX32DRAFT_298076 [Colletotrichum zoysiae]|uniref:Uncharacterized protein n=1 Tax=Colletotrichum zoysiae TaxID=1216348 RepID=A0AAD9H2K8_9PEZI|nr:hypothetical protein LX32DRAFT_298076 [Colletotrichum zoysiae]
MYGYLHSTFLAATVNRWVLLFRLPTTPCPPCRQFVLPRRESAYLVLTSQRNEPSYRALWVDRPFGWSSFNNLNGRFLLRPHHLVICGNCPSSLWTASLFTKKYRHAVRMLKHLCHDGRVARIVSHGLANDGIRRHSHCPAGLGFASHGDAASLGNLACLGTILLRTPERFLEVDLQGREMTHAPARPPTLDEPEDQFAISNTTPAHTEMPRPYTDIQ